MNETKAAVRPLPTDGYLDLHCHVLPGIDDGCRDLEESLAVVRQWVELGLRGAVCTPHVCTTWFPANNPTRIAAWVAELQSCIDDAGVTFDLWPGGELRLAECNLSWLTEHGVPTIGPGRAVLIDWWGNDWPSCCSATVDWLIAAGYQPVLAHPERMGLEDEELVAVVDQLLQQGVWLQGNLNSLGGGEGRAAQRRADRWLAAGAYHLLASDTHGPESVAGRAAGLARVRDMYGERFVHKMLRDRPREVMLTGLAD